MRIDLHLHTTHSDGSLRPGELVERAVDLGLHIIAITDHDSTDGISEALQAAQAHPQLEVIPGVEMSTDTPQGEIHILGYFFHSYQHPELQERLSSLRRARVERGRRILGRLAELDLQLEWRPLEALAEKGVLGRPHIARAMMEKGYVSSFEEAFQEYLGEEGAAYIKMERWTPEEAVRLLRRVGALPVLAHPADIDSLDEMLSRLKAVGLVGLESYYAAYSPERVAQLVELAEKEGLVPCGGSDYHGSLGPVQTELGDARVPSTTVHRLKELAHTVSTSSSELEASPPTSNNPRAFTNGGSKGAKPPCRGSGGVPQS